VTAALLSVVLVLLLLPACKGPQGATGSFLDAFGDLGDMSPCQQQQQEIPSALVGKCPVVWLASAAQQQQQQQWHGTTLPKGGLRHWVLMNKVIMMHPVLAGSGAPLAFSRRARRLDQQQVGAFDGTAAGGMHTVHA
jgi:hypothetical protein